MHTDNLSSTRQYTHAILKGMINYESMFLGISRLGSGNWFQTMEILLLKATSANVIVFSSDLRKFKLET